MNAIITKETASDGINAKAHRKESGYIGGYVAVAVDKDGKTSEPVDLRFYWPGQSTCYACVWIHTPEVYANGSGKASGYGYDHKSAAAAEAFKRAGVSLSEDIDARGDTATHAAVEAVARAVCPDALAIHIVHAHP